MSATSRLTRRGAGMTPLVLASLLTISTALAACGAQSPRAAATATRAPAAPETPTTTYTRAPGVASPTTAVKNGWTAVANLNTVASIAPAPLRIQFQIFTGVTNNGATPALLARRSDDFGVTFHDVTLPAIPGGTNPTNVTHTSAAQSPLNPSVYFLTTQTQQTCASSPCQYQYVTLNGGVSWRTLILPARGVLSVKNIQPADAPAQNQRLYGVVNDVILYSSGTVPPGRLVVSEDGGATWSLADAAIHAANLGIYDYTPVAGSATIYALAGQDLGPGEPQFQPPYSVWRSYDAGATWRKSGSLPGKYSLGFQAARLAASSNVALYTLVGDASDDYHLYASMDGGITWPATYDFHTGRDGNSPHLDPSLLGAFSDGSVAISSYDYSTLKWSPALRAPVTIYTAPPGVFEVMSELLLPPNSLGASYLWIVNQDENGNTTYLYASAK